MIIDPLRLGHLPPPQPRQLPSGQLWRLEERLDTNISATPIYHLALRRLVEILLTFIQWLRPITIRALQLTILALRRFVETLLALANTEARHVVASASIQTVARAVTSIPEQSGGTHCEHKIYTVPCEARETQEDRLDRLCAIVASPLPLESIKSWWVLHLKFFSSVLVSVFQ